MRFAVEHATPGRIRIRTADRISLEESRSLRLAILGIEGVTDVRFYRNTGSIAVFFSGPLDKLTAALAALDGTAIPASKEYPDTKPDSPFLDAGEIERRGLHPHFKRKMRTQILTEAFFDAVMPAPVQLLFHAVQLVRLEKM